jgi:hypothetical protein
MLAALCACLAVPAPALGAVTTSDITSPAPGTHVLFDDSEPTIAVTGTSDGGPGDSVDIVCFERTGQAPAFEENVPVGADGDFSVTSKPDNLAGACRLRALPHNPPAGLPVTPFAGPGIVVEHETTDRIMGGPNADQAFDYFVLNQQDRAMVDYDSVGECGLCDMRLTDISRWTNSHFLYLGAAALYRYNAPDARNSVDIGGRPAYAPAAARVVNPNAAGLPPLSHTLTVAPGTHDLRINESESLVHCPGDPLPANSSNCATFQPAPVRLERTIVQSEAGVLVRITDRWVNTSGSAQRVDLRYDQLFRDPGDGRSPSFDLPWAGGGYRVRAAGQSAQGPASGPATIYVKAASDAPDGSFDLAQGAVTASPAPSRVRFLSPMDYTADYSLTVPVGGSRSVVQIFRMATTRAELVTGARRAEDEFAGPSLTIATPAEGAAVRPAAMLTGTASDNGGVTALEVAGHPVTTGSDGRWSLSLHLPEGPATIEAVARDRFGNTADATRHLIVDGTRPRVRGLRLGARRFAVGGRPTPRSAAPRGTVFRYRLSEPASVTLTIERRAAGLRLAGRGCVPATPRNRRRLARRLAKGVHGLSGRDRARKLKRLRRARRCPAYVSQGVLTRADAAGQVSTPFSGRVGRRALPPGGYRVTVRATDAAGNRSRPVSATFIVVPR